VEKGKLNLDGNCKENNSEECDTISGFTRKPGEGVAQGIITGIIRNWGWDGEKGMNLRGQEEVEMTGVRENSTSRTHHMCHKRII